MLCSLYCNSNFEKEKPECEYILVKKKRKERKKKEKRKKETPHVNF